MIEKIDILDLGAIGVAPRKEEQFSSFPAALEAAELSEVM